MVTLRPGSQTLGTLLDELAAANPTAEAVVWRDHRIDYNTLRERSDEFARTLIALEVKHGDRIALLSDNRPEWLIAAFAIARVGGITAAISTFSTARELEWTLNHAGAKILITMSSVRGRSFLETICNLCPGISAAAPGTIRSEALPDLRTVIVIDGESHGPIINWNDATALGADVDHARLNRVQADITASNICYLLYTSGSTANPKGVLLTHGHVIANGFDIGARQHLCPEDRLWFAIPLFWSFGSANALPAIMTHGGCAVLQESFEADVALSLIERERCTVFYGMANMARAMHDHPEWSKHRLASLRTGLTIGPPEDVRFIMNDLGIEKLCNVYGSTETYGNAAVCDSDDLPELKLHSQGLPLPGMRIRAVDPITRAPLPDGRVGELAIAGYVTPGYFKAPNLTAASFDADGYFLSGDLGMIGTDGRLRYRGRLKEMIKTGGVNVAPLEVEEALLRHPAVKQAYVVGIPDPVKDEIVAAVVELDPDIAVDRTALSAHCRAELASYKVPVHISLRSANQLPRTATGKIHKPGLQTELMEEIRAAEM